MKHFNNQKLTIIYQLLICSLMIFNSPAWAQNFAKNGAAKEEKTAETPESQASTVPVKMDELDPQIQQAISEQNNQLDPSSQEKIANESKYTLGESDVIEISVLRHPELSGQYAINNEGKIQYEFIGDVKVSGLTKKDVADQMAKLLSKYVISPEVTVKIIGYNSKVVYVIGEVGSPGKIFMRGDTITVREALMQAGLPLLSANTPKGSLITPSSSGKAAQKNINIHKLLIEGDLRENLVMKPGDTLYVPPTLMAKAMRVIQPVAAPVGTAAGTARTVYTGGL